MLTFALALSLFACDNASVSPAGPTTTSTPPATTTVPPVFNPGIMFDWNGTRGILVFAGTQAQESDIMILDSTLRGLGWPTPTYHVCSEVARWESTPWADGEEPFSDENLENLRRFLRVTAELGSQVLLDVFCTVRDAPAWMDMNGELYAQTVAEIAKEYEHVAIHIANEAWHGDSWFQNNDGRLRLMRDTLRTAGFQGLIGSDDNASRPGDTRYNRAWRDLGFWPDFHPWRLEATRLPNRADFAEMAERNPFGTVVISEPIAYSTWRDEDCCTADQEIILRNMRQAEAEGLIWIYHSTCGLEWPKLCATFDWIPS